MQPGRPQIPQEETCPVPENLLGMLYRATPHGLDSLIATVPARTRAMLALYCHSRGHLQSIGFAVAASCQLHDLEEIGGHAGRVLYEKAREAPEQVQPTHYVGRKKVSLSRGHIMQVVIDQDLV